MSDESEIRVEIEGEAPTAGRRSEMSADAQRAARAEAAALHWQRQAQVERVARVTEVTDREYDTIVTGIHAAQAEMAQAEQAQAKAWEEGRLADASRLQSANSIAAARLVELESAKAHLEA
jgi:hypothetical protein